MNHGSHENNSLPAPVVSPLSREWRGGGRSNEGLGPLIHPPLILSASGCYHLFTCEILSPSCLHIRALSTRPHSSPVSLVDATACLLFILYRLSVCLPLRICLCFIGQSPTLPLPWLHPLHSYCIGKGPAPPLTVSSLIVFSKAAGKERADEETQNRLLEALCTLGAEWSHCK